MSIAPVGGRGALRSGAHDVAVFADLVARLDGAQRDHQNVSLVVDGAGETVLPDAVVRALRDAAAALARSGGAAVASADVELTTQEAADLLRVSRPHLIKLLDRGDLPHHRTSEDTKAHRRVLAADVRAYDERRRQARRASLRELTQVSQEAEGGYL